MLNQDLHRRWVLRTVLFSILASPALAIIMNLVDPLAPRDEFGKEVLVLGGFSSAFVIGALLLVFVALLVTRLVTMGLLERGDKSVPFRVASFWRFALSYALLLMLGLIFAVPV